MGAWSISIEAAGSFLSFASPDTPAAYELLFPAGRWMCSGLHDLIVAPARARANHPRQREHEWHLLVELRPGRASSWPCPWSTRARQIQAVVADERQACITPRHGRGTSLQSRGGQAGELASSAETSCARQNMMTTQVPLAANALFTSPPGADDELEICTLLPMPSSPLLAAGQLSLLVLRCYGVNDAFSKRRSVVQNKKDACIVYPAS